jgi:hypothetical protein
MLSVIWKYAAPPKQLSKSRHTATFPSPKRH